MASKSQKKIVKKDIGTFSALEAVKNSEGGKIILAALTKDVVASIDTISSKYKDCNYEQLVALCARLSERLALYRTINRSSKNKKMAQEELSVLERI